MNRRRFPLLLPAFAFLRVAAEPRCRRDVVPPVKTETVVGGLDNPVAVAMRATGGDLFVSESGAGGSSASRPAKRRSRSRPITGFPVGPSPDCPICALARWASLLPRRITWSSAAAAKGRKKTPCELSSFRRP